MAAGRVGVQIDADEPVFIDAAVDLGEAVLRRDTGALRQHRHTYEVLREQGTDAVDQLVARAGPSLAGRGIAKVMAHTGGARREDRQVGAALALQFELTIDDRLMDLLVGYRGARRR